MSEKQDYFCRPLKLGDEKEVRMLVENCFGDFLEGKFWDWKYKLNPSFDPSLVVVAERDGRIIGCNHWLRKTFMLSQGLETEAILGADIAVSSDYRNKGVGKALLRCLRLSANKCGEKPSIVYMFADPSVAKHFHTLSGGYIPAPDKTIFYFRILNWKKLIRNVHELNKQIAAGRTRRKSTKFELTVFFKISHAPPLFLFMTEKGVRVGETEKDHEKTADIVITADYATLRKVGAEKKRLRNLIRALLTRKLGIRSKPTKLLNFYRNLWILQAIFERGIT
jgi:predicted N-acetyltransferase YhbS